MTMIEAIHAKLEQLTDAQLRTVSEYIDLLLTEDADGDQETPPGDEAQGAGRSPAGWIELKIINGNGPYAYRRWREGGKLRSKYIGKVREQ